MRSARMLLAGFGLFGIFFPVLAPAGTAQPVLVTVDSWNGVAYGSVIDSRGPGNAYLQCSLDSGRIRRRYCRGWGILCELGATEMCQQMESALEFHGQTAEVLGPEPRL